MNINKLRISIGIALVLAAAAPAEALALQAVGSTGSGSSMSNERHLRGEMISKSAQRIVTTVGAYDLGLGVTVDDRRQRIGATQDDKERPRVDLKFQRDQLRHITIY